MQLPFCLCLLIACVGQPGLEGFDGAVDVVALGISLEGSQLEVGKFGDEMELTTLTPM